MRNHILTVTYALALGAKKAIRHTIGGRGLGVRGLVVRGEEVLLVRHRAGVLPWGLPGGAVGKRETPQEAVQREVQEESGCAVAVDHLHGLFTSRNGKFHDCILVFVCHPLNPLVSPTPPPFDLEIADACYVPLRTLRAGTNWETHYYVAGYLGGRSAVVETLEWGARCDASRPVSELPCHR